MIVPNAVTSPLAIPFAFGSMSEPEANSPVDVLPIPSAESRLFARGLAVALSISIPFWCTVGYGVVLLLR